jgi:DNA-binding IclR family transcriptional regulator
VNNHKEKFSGANHLIDDLQIHSDTEEEAKDRQFVTALARGLEVLHCFTPEERLLGHQDIVRRTGLPKATVSRLAHTLTKTGHLSYAPELGKYYLGTRVLSLGHSLLTNMNILKIARPSMQELADYSHAAVSLGARDRLNMVYLESCRCVDTTFTLRLEAGARIPLATTAMGRALLCAVPEEERDYLLDHIRRHNELEWPKTKAGIEKSFEEYEKWGMCFSLGDWRQDVNAVAVAMKPVTGAGVLTFNCGGPSFLLRRHMLEDDLGPRLVNMVRNIEAEAARQ